MVPGLRAGRILVLYAMVSQRMWGEGKKGGVWALEGLIEKSKPWYRQDVLLCLRIN